MTVAVGANNDSPLFNFLSWGPAPKPLHPKRGAYHWGRGFPPVDWLTHRGTESLGDYLEAQWRTELWVTITRQTVAWENYVERIFLQPPQMFLWGCLADYPDPDYFLRLGDHKRLTSWSDETYNALVESAGRVTNLEQRLRIYREADMILIEAAPLIPLVYSHRNLLLKPWVRAYPASAFKWWFWKDVLIARH